MTQFDSVFHYISTSTFNTLRTVRMKCSVELFEHVMELPFSRQDLQRSHVVDCPITFRHLLNTCKNILNVLNLSSIFKYETYSYFSFCQWMLSAAMRNHTLPNWATSCCMRSTTRRSSSRKRTWQQRRSDFVAAICKHIHFYHVPSSSTILYHFLSHSIMISIVSIVFYHILWYSIMFYHF